MINYNVFFTTLKNGTVLIIDTCLALHDRFPEFLDALECFEAPHFKTLVPIDVYLETSKLSVTGKTEETKHRAAEALVLMHRGFANNTLQLLKEYSTGSFFADPSIIAATLSLSTSSDTILLTQDVNLSRTIRVLSKSEAISGGLLDVYKLASRGGGLYCFTDLSQKESDNSQMTKVQFYIKDGIIDNIQYLRKEA